MSFKSFLAMCDKSLFNTTFTKMFDKKAKNLTKRKRIIIVVMYGMSYYIHFLRISVGMGSSLQCVDGLFKVMLLISRSLAG